jgi:hypothetical protein
MAQATAIQATGTFRVSSMEEDTYQPLEQGGKLTRARGDQAFSGDIQGDGHVEWLMCYRADGSARFIGHQLMSCSVEGRRGTFVIEATGEFSGKTSKGDWEIIPGSGTGELAGIRGDGGFEAEHGPDATYQLNIAFD